MGIFIDHNLCNGCGYPESETPCNIACPGDLIFMQTNSKAQIFSNADCWDCAACIKICPQQAIELKLPFEIVGKEGSLKARAYRDKTIWTAKDENGGEQIFETPARNSRGEATSPLLSPDEFTDCIDSYKGISKTFVDLGSDI
ncbi:MAG: adenylylsulfate reductase [Candidatus Melainabacteria bacterium]|nr:adenylylsulfate reductase [Candidatus Melainabacteria bacterium]